MLHFLFIINKNIIYFFFLHTIREVIKIQRTDLSVLSRGGGGRANVGCFFYYFVGTRGGGGGVGSMSVVKIYL